MRRQRVRLDLIYFLRVRDANFHPRRHSAPNDASAGLIPALLRPRMFGAATVDEDR